MKRLIIAGAAALMALPMFGQTTPEEVMNDFDKAGGVYYAYPVTVSQNTPVPEGYTPHYISHYGRHGSRYLISDEDYLKVARTLHAAAEAGALSPLGRDVMQRVDSVLIEAKGRGGDLSPLGVRQHRGIAERMYASFPEVFAGDAPVSARSTTVIRCVLSMDAFCERLKELNPELRTTRESSGRYMDYLNYHSPESNAYTGGDEWREEYRKFEQAHTNPDRLMGTLFTDADYVRRKVNPEELMWGLYWIAVGMQDIETELSFYDLFTPQEMFDLWQCPNYHFYVCDHNYPDNRGLVVGNASNLLRNIIESADEALQSDKPSATLRFGHDGNLIPLSAILRLKDCYNSESNPEDFYKAFATFRISPMAGNIQMVFFRPDGADPKPEDYLVKFMLNERETSIPVKTDTWPFYRWGDVRDYYLTEILK